MTKEKFVKMLKCRGYKETNLYEPRKPEFSVWEKEQSNILIEVRNVTFARVIRFLNGRLGYIEALPFKRYNCIY